MPGAEGYVNDPPAAVNADSTAATKDSLIALQKANKNLMRALLAKWPDQSGGKVPVEATITQKAQLHANIDFSSASAQIIIAAPGGGKRIRLTRLSLSSGGTPQVNVEIALKSGATSIETVKGAAMVFDYPEHRNLGINEAFVVQCTTADRVIGGVDYYVEAVV